MDILHFLKFNNPTIILTDANVKHRNFGHTSSDELGKLLNRFNLSHGLHFMGPDFHTFFSNNNSGKPDLILGNTALLQMAHHITEGPRNIASDHIPTIIDLSTSPLAIPHNTKYNTNRADWDKFNEHMQQLQTPNIINKPTEQIDELWTTFTNHILNGAHNYIPKTSYKIIPSFTLSTRTKNLQKIYSERHKQYQNNITPENIQILNTIGEHIRSSRERDLCHYWSTKMEDLKSSKIRMIPEIYIKL